MNFTQRVVGIFLIVITAGAVRIHAQNNDIEKLFRSLEMKNAEERPGTLDESEPVLEQFAGVSKETVANALPLILHEANNPRLSIRRVAATALYVISTRPDGQALLSAETATFTTLLVDPDIPIRRMSMLAVATLRPNANSPIVPFLETYLSREDAVSTIGAFVATVLMEAAPDDAESTHAVAQFMHRSDQTLENREALLNAIATRLKSNNLAIAKEVAVYADDPDEEISVRAIRTLQRMGKSAVQDNQQSLSRIAADLKRAPSVRAAAQKALADAADSGR